MKETETAALLTSGVLIAEMEQLNWPAFSISLLEDRPYANMSGRSIDLTSHVGLHGIEANCNEVVERHSPVATLSLVDLRL